MRWYLTTVAPKAGKTGRTGKLDELDGRVYCVGEQISSAMSYHQFQDENGSSYGSFEVFFDNGFHWRACFPGCLPDGDAFGPFETEEEAINDALAV